MCKSDYNAQVKAAKTAEKQIVELKKAGKPFSSIKFSPVAHHEYYGVWFFGQLEEIIRTVSREQFGIELSKQMHVFIDVDPKKKIEDGIHELSVYGRSCRLYKWMAQGCHRGLVVLAEDENANHAAEVYRQSDTWSFMLDTNPKACIAKEEVV